MTRKLHVLFPVIAFLCVVLGITIGIRRTANVMTDSDTPEILQKTAESIANNKLRGQTIFASTKDKNGKGTEVAIFYNLYIPKDREGSKSTYNIIMEQLAQVAESAAASNRKKMTLYYVTIGEQVHEKFMDETCSFYDFNCVHVSHHDTGYEMATEQALLDYCTENDHEHHIVSYIHDKGSKNQLDHQARLRKLLTWTSLSEECMGRLSENECNVCGANFKSLWGPTYWGNMWSARCDYVKKLISPFQVYSRSLEAYNSKPDGMTAEFFTPGPSPQDQYSVNDYSLGWERFAAEQFIGNHPSLIPCSFRKPEDQENAIWSVDPPGAFDLYVMHTKEHTTIEKLEEENKRMKEWYLLPGILWRYYKLYNEIPPPDSWIWRHYPDGDIWKEKIQLWGFPQALYSQVQGSTNQ